MEEPASYPWCGDAGPEGYPGHFWFWHMCKEIDSDYEPVRQSSLLPINSQGWSYDAETDTVEPSIQCLGCGTHGWWREGKWIPA
jgi:hypothetical protein